MRVSTIEQRQTEDEDWDGTAADREGTEEQRDKVSQQMSQVREAGHMLTPSFFVSLRYWLSGY